MKRQLVITPLATLLLAGCSPGSSDFGSAATASPEPSAKRSSIDSTAQQSQAPANPSAATTTTPTPAPARVLTEQQKFEECWAAVSGTYLGRNDYSDVFPSTLSGRAFDRGSAFDTVGGRFLSPRPSAYSADSPDNILKDAVVHTLDSLAVAPGIVVEGRTSEAANVPLFVIEGPAIVLHGSEQGQGYGTPSTYQDVMASGFIAKWPAWMKDYLKASNGRVKIATLQAANWIKVTAKSGGPCAN